MVLVHAEKRATENLLENFFSHFIPYMTIFYWGGDKKTAEVAQQL
jgi:hypothetical protein